MDRKDLKIQALLERVSNLTAEAENKVADLRVDLTMVSQERDELRQRVEELENAQSAKTDQPVATEED